MLVTVTGSNGFVGSALCRALTSAGHFVRAASRKIPTTIDRQNVEHIEIGEMNSKTEWSLALAGVDCVIHCAARAHVMSDVAEYPLSAYRSVNVDGSRRLAEQAADSGVQRLVYISSIKVNGEKTISGSPFSTYDSPAPVDPYSLSKWEAERALWEVASRTGLEIVIVRPPLIYGPGVKGNLARLLRLIRLGMPLPFATLRNRRSLIGLDNLLDFLIRCVELPAAKDQTFLVCDGEDLSTADLVRHMATAAGCPTKLVPVPLFMLRYGATILNKKAEIERLVESLEIDNRHSCERLKWTPAVNVPEGIRRMIQV